ncbi:type IV toxin-antitoxin system AbiEi family antitoxin domain-containing protein [Actinoplanes oblitus]|uniref:Type IV toxin-antitoxin system AbiEi family antitoxin domain-containing protein n=1 Tax=Actinoplanes oblitus TaxID=3040509 RepID=A0ABY8WF62_9ACTN|nr:type IV toxin-antitoxin system AbiEi family antitoxin domain-containing protein [Actinoplanes oblitus]WIM95577.1 type IV toxin-antitoxin system AbiEi family antitoxin domain-containing protein [Actinoplanes oblitus]
MAHLDDISGRQCGVVSREQALQAGIGAETVRRHLRSGRWQRMIPGIYATFADRPPPGARRWAAVLHAGSGAMLCCRSAAEEAGLAAPGREAIHVLIPDTRRISPVRGLVAHRSRHAADRRDPLRLPPQTRVEETVLDLASTAGDPAEALHWISTACTRRLTTPSRLTTALSARPRLHRRGAMHTLLGAVARGYPAPLPDWPPLPHRWALR